MTKLTCKKIKEFIKDEQHAIKDYAKYNLTSLSKDEGKLRKFLKVKLRKLCAL